MSVSPLALRLLDRIEAIEMRSLEWGYTDGALTEDEALALAGAVGRETGSGASGDDLLEALIDAKLVFELQDIGAGVRIRSRFGELMRLLASNRQLFPNKPWQGAPHLVADFRVDRRARRFPRRDRQPSDVLAESAAVAPSALGRELWQALTARPGTMLAAFQERAALRLAAPTDDAGTIITAGTGSGKTIAFYLPAMLRIGEVIGPDPWVKAIAVYPRIELLKDQFAEAFRMARSIDAPLARHGRRPLRIGALFGATPTRAHPKELADKRWRARGADFVCPWMRCPVCDAELVWRQADIAAGTERLICIRHDCDGAVGEDHLILTRNRLQRQPPDILFTTTEILNQRLSDHWMRGLFGVGSPAGRKPFLALLDEVHTYVGPSGAHAALTLRRWRHLLGAPLSWVGLSATLGDAAQFFADLTGANLDAVVEITPSLDEYEEDGAEYQVLLRGDPASRASLLATTIQVSMLLSRALDPPGANSVSGGAFGRRAFLFTDDLDVTNRLYDDLRDAEAYTIFGKPDAQRQPLAALRGAGPDAALRDVQGQRWRICEAIGHPLDRRLIVGRTTSQDAGVNQSANVVVATAALEVGFNDPLVGAVIQHKAPRGMAAFLQRKGRAGRDRAMRPITLTVLSDYGRDRAFYQAYEHLFDPTLEPQHLPIQNPYVLKIQAVFALFDWLAARTSGFEKAWQWDLLSRPLDSPSRELRTVIDATRARLTQLVQGDVATINDLRGYLVSALGVSEATAQSLLWEAPRSLLLEAVPTLVRRLFRQWRLAFPGPGGDLDLKVDHHPLPDFVPRTLFGDLSLPEVRVVLPPATVNHEERVETMPVLQALNQLVPGRVTRRFAFERGALSHWVAVDPALPEQDRRISDYAEEHEFVGTFTGRLNDPGDGQALLVFRPWTVRLAKVARSEALPSSNARLAWLTDMIANGEPLSVPIPPRSAWRGRVEAIDFHLHRFRASVSVRRFAPRAHANVRTLTDDFPVTLHFKSDDERPAAVGFELEVDGFRIDLALGDPSTLAADALPDSLLAASRLGFLRDSFRLDPELPDDLNGFQRDWLLQILISAVLAEAATTDAAFDAVVADLLSEDRLEAAFRAVMDDLFGAIPPNLQDDDEADDDSITDEDQDQAEAEAGDPDAASVGRSGGTSTHRGGGGRLQQALTDQLARPPVRDRLRAIADQLRVQDPAAFGVWLRRLVLETLGEAALQACIASAPRQATLENLLVDIRDDTASGGASVWITETTIGGAGVLEAFAESFTAEPRIFFAALEAALAPTDLELVDGGLRRVLTLALSDPAFAEEIARLRATHSHAERAAQWQALAQRLAQRGGIDLSHALSVSLNNRLLRSGSGPQLDRLLLDLQTRWDSLEARFGLSIGLREFAYICSRDPRLAGAVRAFLTATLPAAAAGQVSVIAAVTNLLWPRSDEVRQRALQSHNPYREARSTDPAVVRHLLLRQAISTIEIADPDWHEQLSAAFVARGTARLAADAGEGAALRKALVGLVATPVDVGVLQFFPAVERVERSDGRILVGLTLREQV